MDTVSSNVMWLQRGQMIVIVTIIVVAYLVVAQSSALDTNALSTFTRGIWTFGSVMAVISCSETARLSVDAERRAWKLIAVACGSWCVGQILWALFTILQGAMPATPHWVQIFFFGYPAIFLAGLLLLPRQRGMVGFTIRHWGNLALLLCAIAVSFVVTLRAPSLLPDRAWLANVVAVGTALTYALASATALYLLWSYRWAKGFWPLAMLAAGMGIQAATYLANIHLRMTGNYETNAWFQVGWFLGFGIVACAAYEYAWQMRHAQTPNDTAVVARERRLEAVIPAALFMLMLIATWLNAGWLTTHVAAIATGFAATFAVVLSFRDAWIQREEQRLLVALNDSNDNLVVANRRLAVSEGRYRSLNADLERRVADRTSELQAAYRELESFSYAVAHDIKAPLRAVNSFASLLIEEHGRQLTEGARGYAQRMQRGALHMTQLVDDLLAYTRVERLELQPEPLALDKLIQDCLDEWRDEAAKLRAEVTVQVQPLTIRVDKSAFTQTLRNLLQNALKFSSRSTPPRIAIKAERHGDRIGITVADNGIGFDMQYHDRIFALFQRLHRLDEFPGTGIGLAIARKAIERMGGRMWAQSEMGSGATFCIELPAD